MGEGQPEHGTGHNRPAFDLRFTLNAQFGVDIDGPIAPAPQEQARGAPPSDAARGVVRLYDAFRDFQRARLGGDADFAARQREELERCGGALFNAVLGSRGGVLQRVLLQALKDKEGEGPLLLWIQGTWSSLPWELMRLPACPLTGRPETWLGEIAIVSGLDADPLAPSYPTIAYENVVRIVSMVGQDLAHLEPELAHLEALKADGVELTRFDSVSDYNKGERLTNLLGLLNGPPETQILHAVCHAQPSDDDDFAFELHDKTRVNRWDFESARFNVQAQNVAFLNTCFGYKQGAVGKPSIGDFALTNCGAQACIAAGCELEDVEAAAFSKLFFGHFLPVNGSTGATVGDALFAARQELLAETGSLLGYCYRLLGRHTVRLEQVKRPAL